MRPCFSSASSPALMRVCRLRGRGRRKGFLQQGRDGYAADRVLVGWHLGRLRRARDQIARWCVLRSRRPSPMLLTLFAATQPKFVRAFGQGYANFVAKKVRIQWCSLLLLPDMPCFSMRPRSLRVLVVLCVMFFPQSGPAQDGAAAALARPDQDGTLGCRTVHRRAQGGR